LEKRFPDRIHVLTGVALADPNTGQRATLDLVVVTEAAAFVGIHSHQNVHPNTTPRTAVRALVDSLQRNQVIVQPLPVYAFWLAETPPEGRDEDVPVLPDASAVRQYVLLGDADRPYLQANTADSVAEGLLGQDAGLREHTHSPTGRLPRALLGLAELPRRIEAGLQEQIRQPFFLRREPILPADVNGHLVKAMLARESVLEDADYTKIVPNDYIVELNEDNYRRNYRPIEQHVCERWRASLALALDTTNNRWGREKYRFGGQVRVGIRASSDLAESRVRIQCRVDPNVGTGLTGTASACLELVSDGRRWPLPKGSVTIGRDRVCDICLHIPAVQRARLVSGQHAYIIYRDKGYWLFDGVPGGRPSTNGTFVNGQRVGRDGWELNEGDIIILAALDPNRPSLDTPGVVALSFHMNCAEQT